MKKYLILVFAMVQFALFAQEKKDFLVGVNFSPEVASRLTTVAKDDFGIHTIVEERSSFPSKLALSSGFVLNYFLKDKVFFETGLQYSIKGNKSRLNNFFTWQTTSTYLEPKYRSVSTKENFHFIEIPIIIGKIWGNKKVKFFFKTGFNIEFFIFETSISKYKLLNGEIEKYRNSNSPNENQNIFNFSPVIAIGVDIALNEKIHLRFAPITRISIINIDKNWSYRYHYLNLGLNLSCFMKI